MLQQTLENSTLTPDEVMEDDLVGQGVTSASLSAIFEKPDAIAEIDAKPASCVFSTLDEIRVSPKDVVSNHALEQKGDIHPADKTSSNEQNATTGDLESLITKNVKINHIAVCHDKSVRCTYCNSDNITTKGTRKNKNGSIARRFKCSACSKQFSITS